MKILLLASIFIFNFVHADSCDSAAGIDLSAPGGPYNGVHTTDQGNLGTCYAHSATNLLRSRHDISSYVNIIDAVMNSEHAVSGGHVKDVINGLMERKGPCMLRGKKYENRPWVCLNSTEFENLFPSKKVNIIAELNEIILEMPILYSNTMTNKHVYNPRPKAIADEAIRQIREGDPECSYMNRLSHYHQEYKKLIEQYDSIADHLRDLKEERSSTIVSEWINVNIWGERPNSDIDAEIEEKKNLLRETNNQRQVAFDKYYEMEKLFENSNRRYDTFDSLSITDAASMVKAWAQRVYPKYKNVFAKYGISKYAGSIEDFINKSLWDPEHGYQYSGQDYGYKRVQDAVNDGCYLANRHCLESNLSVESMNVKKEGSTKVISQMERLLEQEKPQGISLNVAIKVLDGTDRGYHGVNVIGCRTVDYNGYKQKEFLIMNSWGESCKSYKTSLQKTCVDGKVWVPADYAINNSTGIQWID